jgi:hypothetical protein
LKVTNTGTVPLTLYLMGRVPTADFQIADERGRTVWSRLRGQTMLAPLRLYPLEAGQQLILRHTWNGHDDSSSVLPPGDYLIRGVLLTDDPAGLSSTPQQIRIER